MSGYDCKSLEFAEQMIIVGRTDKHPVGHAGRILAVDEFRRFGRNTPVSIFIGTDEALSRTFVFPEMKQPFLHGSIML